MSYIESLTIKGIRNFDPKNAQKIEFFRPLTLIIGNNGSGKTVRDIYIIYYSVKHFTFLSS